MGSSAWRGPAATVRDAFRIRESCIGTFCPHRRQIRYECLSGGRSVSVLECSCLKENKFFFLLPAFLGRPGVQYEPDVRATSVATLSTNMATFLGSCGRQTSAMFSVLARNHLNRGEPRKEQKVHFAIPLQLKQIRSDTSLHHFSIEKNLGRPLMDLEKKNTVCYIIYFIMMRPLTSLPGGQSRRLLFLPRRGLPTAFFYSSLRTRGVGIGTDYYRNRFSCTGVHWIEGCVSLWALRGSGRDHDRS